MEGVTPGRGDTQGQPWPFPGTGRVSAQALAPVWPPVSHWAGRGRRVLPSDPALTWCCLCVSLAASLCCLPTMVASPLVPTAPLTSCFVPKTGGVTSQKNPKSFLKALGASSFKQKSSEGSPVALLDCATVTQGVPRASQAVVWELRCSRAPKSGFKVLKSSSRAPEAAWGSAARSVRAAEDV